MFSQLLISFLFYYFGIPGISSKKLVCPLSSEHYLNPVIMCKLYCSIYWNCNLYLSSICILNHIENLWNYLFYFIMSEFINS